MFLIQIPLFFPPKFQNLAVTWQGTYAGEGKCTVKYIICAKLITEDTHLFNSEYLYALFI